MLLVLLAAGAAQTIAPATARLPDPLSCNPGLARTAVLSPAQARKLGELPPGLLQLAVDKRVAGCSVTVLPTRDANGHHMMLQGDTARPQRAQGSAPERGRQRER